MALVGLLLTILLLGGLVAGSIVAVGSLSGTGSSGGAAGARPSGRTGSATTIPVPLVSAPQEALVEAAATEKTVLTTAESTYFAVHGCYVAASGLVTAGVLHQPPTYWTVTTAAGPCPQSYTLVASGRTSTSSSSAGP